MATPPVFNAVLDEYITQAFALAMTNADDAEIDALFGSVFEEQAQSVKTNTASVDMDFKCVKVDGEWKIAAFSEEDERLIDDLVTGNMVSVMESYDIFGKDYEDDYDYEDGAIPRRSYHGPISRWATELSLVRSVSGLPTVMRCPSCP